MPMLSIRHVYQYGLLVIWRQLCIGGVGSTFNVCHIFLLLHFEHFLRIRNMIDLFGEIILARPLWDAVALTQFHYLLSIISMNIFARQKSTENKRR